MRCDIFILRGCPDCRAVLRFCKERIYAARAINCGTDGGEETASERGVSDYPTAIFYDACGEEVARGRTVDEIRALHSAGAIRYDRLPQ